MSPGRPAVGAMSQVLGKPQPEEEEDDEEEDELVGLADYGDGPDSSDAEPDSGAEEGGERRVPGSAPRREDLGRHPRRAGRAGRGLGGDPGERSFGVGVGRGAGGAVASCKMGEPGCRQRRGDRDRWRRQRGGVWTERALSGSSELSVGSGGWGGEGPTGVPGTSP